MITKDELEEKYKLYEMTGRQLEEMEFDQFIQIYLAAKKQLETLGNELDEWAEDIGKSLDEENWAKDKFSKGKKDIAIDGKMRLYRSRKTTRTIRTKDFVATYPFLANEMIERGTIKIPIKATEDEIGKKELDAICDKKTTYTYELVFWKEEAHEQTQSTNEGEKDDEQHRQGNTQTCENQSN